GKVFIFQWVVPGAIATEFRNDPEVVWNAVAVDMLRTGDLAEGQLAHIGEHQESGGTLPLDDDIKRRVDGRLSGMSEAEIDAAIDAYVGAVFGGVPWSEQIGALLSPWDLLW